MAAHPAIGGLGTNAVLSVLGGSGIAAGAVGNIANPSFEVPGVDPGTAANWTLGTQSSLEEYAVFTHPGSSVLVGMIPATTPTTGITVVHEPDGTIRLIQAPGIAPAQEDFEQGWQGNEAFAFVLPDSMAEAVIFGAKTVENFEDGWDNDAGLLDNFTALLSGNPHFGSVESPPTDTAFEAFGYGWPSGNAGVYTTEFPNIVLGLIYLNVRVTHATNPGTPAPIVVTSDRPHYLTTGDTVTITGVLGNTAANGTFAVTVLGAADFSLDGSTGNGPYGGGGVVQRSVVYKHDPGNTGLTAPEFGDVALLRYLTDVEAVGGLLYVKNKAASFAAYTANLAAGTAGALHPLATPTNGVLDVYDWLTQSAGVIQAETEPGPALSRALFNP